MIIHYFNNRSDCVFQRITLSDMRAFMALLNALDDFEAAVALHILAGQQLNRTEFERAVYGTSINAW